MTIRYTITPTSITVLLHGKNWQIDKSHVNFIAVRDKLLDESGSSSEERMVAELTPLVNIPVFIATVSTGRVQISGDAVMFDGAPVHGHIAERLLTMVRKGRNPRPLMRFLERLQRAPIKNVADQFLRWLEHSNMPLTADGCFVAYKYVSIETHDEDGIERYVDSWSKKIDNSPGAVIPRLEPNRINTDRNQTCAASGYHFCSFGYLGGQRPVMLLKIAPEDVCSFPETEEAKGRCLFYEIINRIPDDAVATRVIEGGDLIYTGLYAIDPAPFRTPDTQPTVAAAMSPGGLGAAESSDAEGYEDDEDEDGGTDPADVSSLLNTKPKKRSKRSSAEKNASAKEKWLARLKGTKVSGKRLTETSIKALVEKHGQREVARRTGIPRTTLQEWVK